jgi:hypothetical protein
VLPPPPVATAHIAHVTGGPKWAESMLRVISVHTRL